MELTLFNCPACGSKTKVRQTMAGGIQYRDCAGGHSFKTQSVVVKTITLLTEPKLKKVRDGKLPENKILAKQETPPKRGIFTLSKLWLRGSDTSGT
jgi:hypothetical protein